MADIILGQEILETVRIKDYKGNILSEFSFNPSDTNIVGRYEEFVNAFAEIGTKIEEYEKASGDKGKFEKAKDMIAEIDSHIYEQFNRLLNEDVAKDIFSVMGPLSPTPHGYYVTFILEQIAEAINKATGVRLKKIESKVKKHTGKYYGK